MDTGWPIPLQRDRFGNIKPLLINVLQFFEYHDRWAARFHFNQLINKEEIFWDRDNPWSPVADVHIDKLCAWFEENYHISVTPEVMRRAVRIKTFENPSHIIMETLNALTWD